MKHEEEQKLSGEAMGGAAQMALLELLNGGPEPGSLSVEDRHRHYLQIIRKDGKRIGKIFVASTVEDMDKKNRA